MSGLINRKRVGIVPVASLTPSLTKGGVVASLTPLTPLASSPTVVVISVAVAKVSSLAPSLAPSLVSLAVVA
jgi:hypothetical protein